LLAFARREVVRPRVMDLNNVVIDVRELLGSGTLRPDIRGPFMFGYAQPIRASHGIVDSAVTLIAIPFTEPDLLTEIRRALNAKPRPDLT
jgi:hypothetical protein